jgi:hypothetical protein
MTRHRAGTSAAKHKIKMRKQRKKMNEKNK